MMGSALCVPLADQGHDVRLIGTPLDASIISALKALDMPLSEFCRP
jgi:glycerol-3-phosphate dehydrogenase (NAD(P)+)